MGRRTTLYRGELAKPLLLPRRTVQRRLQARPVLSLTNSNTSATVLPGVLVEPSLVPMWRSDFDEKFRLLFDHFKIAPDDPDQWRKLSLCLAVRHVPGFQERAAKKTGRPRTMSRRDEERLYERFTQLRRNGLSGMNAARLIAKDFLKSHQTVTATAILRRMQRREKQAKAGGDLLSLIVGRVLARQNSGI